MEEWANGEWAASTMREMTRNEARFYHKEEEGPTLGEVLSVSSDPE
jgi:hypothetical protein